MDDKMSKALDAVYEETSKLLRLNLPPEVRDGLNQILSISRYKFDNRPSDRRQKTSE